MNKIIFSGHRDRVINPIHLETIAALYEGVIWVHGGALGFDTQVAEYAKSKGIATEVVRPDYSDPAISYKAAPHIRNKKMVDMGPVLVALWDGRKTGGTWATIEYARRRGKKIITFGPERKP